MLTLLFIGILSLTFDIQQVEASGTIYIRADGSIWGTTDIMTVDNVTYTFTANINDSIVVERNNITIDGAGYTVQGTGSGTGIDLSYRNNVTLKNVEVTNFNNGIYLLYSTNNTVTGNTASNGIDGISLYSSSNNTLAGNNVSSNNYDGIYLGQSSNNNIIGNTASNDESGIHLSDSTNNTVTGNTVSSNGYEGIYIVTSSNNTVTGNTASNNSYGIFLYHSSNNTLFHNNLINNTVQASVTTGYVNTWDDGYPSGGNYWSNYTGVDLDHDGIGDTEHVIDANNTDNYPLMGMFSDFKATSENHVQTICNSSISDFQYNETAICFNVSGEDDTSGFCRICIPRALMNETYQVFVNGTEVQCNLLPCSNTTHSYLYFTYNHSTQEVIIIPEFPSFLILPLFMAATLLAVIIIKRKHRANLRVPV